MTINVMLVDDSAVARQVLSQALAPAPDIKVIGTAADPVIARQKMTDLWPDVIVLDVDMPRMDGITFLKNLMNERPTAVVICSALSEDNAKIAMQAMSSGAVSVVSKPMSNGRIQLEELSTQLIDEVRAAVRARLVRRGAPTAMVASTAPSAPPTSNNTSSLGTSRGVSPTTAASSPTSIRSASSSTPVASPRDSTSAVLANTMQERQAAPRLTADAMLPPPKPMAPNTAMKTAQQIVAIGVSTGGTQALEYLLPKLPAQCVGLAIVQHMPGTLTGAFAKRLNELSTITVKEARDGDQILPGQALICPGSHHMMIRRSGIHYFVDIKEGPLVNRHRPSVDVLFRSAAASSNINVTGIIMTGMGDDGARGMKEMFDCGSYTIAQDEATCTVFGMPKEAIKLGGVKETLSIDKIAAKIASIK